MPAPPPPPLTLHNATSDETFYDSPMPDSTSGTATAVMTPGWPTSSSSSPTSLKHAHAHAHSESWILRCRCSLRSWMRVSAHHFKRHVGSGIICSVAYFDPGNWSVDLQAGSQFGYKLLFVVLLAGLMAVVFQVMATRLGCVTGLDLAAHCRILLTNPPLSPSSSKPATLRTRLARIARPFTLYALYALSEIAIISTDLAELLGSATAISLLFPAIPLWAGVLMTTADVFLILIFVDAGIGGEGDAAGKDGKKGEMKGRVFELLIGILVLAVFISLMIVIVRVSPAWGPAFKGFLPSKTIFGPDALYISVGIIGATVMPHGLFLGSSLATKTRVSPDQQREFERELALACVEQEKEKEKMRSKEARLEEAEAEGYMPDEKKKNIGMGTGMDSTMTSAMSSVVDFADAISMPMPLSISHSKRPHTFSTLKSFFKQSLITTFTIAPKQDESREIGDGDGRDKNNSLEFVRAHLRHGIVDIVFSLLGFAVVINSLILILAAAVFYNTSSGMDASASLFTADSLIQSIVGKAAAVLFALGLLCAGQSASITATLAGQVVSEGFLRWRISPFLRRLLTRLIGLVPSMLVAVIVGPDGVNTLLVLSQVILSVVLPFVAFPLVWLTSKGEVMRVRVPRESVGDVSDNGLNSAETTTPNTTPTTTSTATDLLPPSPPTSEAPPTPSTPQYDYIDYSNGKIMTTLGYAIWLVIAVANVYVLVTLALGSG